MEEIYAWEAVREAIIAIGKEEASSADIKNYIENKYPGKFQPGTVSAHLRSCCVNNPSRAKVHEHKLKNNKYDILFCINRGKYQLYNPAKHGYYKNGIRE
jgi:hypothetical protein